MKKTVIDFSVVLSALGEAAAETVDAVESGASGRQCADSRR